MASTTASALEPGDMAVYGVMEGWRHLWDQAKREGRDWYYLDNSYVDCARGRYFRVTRNALQAKGTEAPDWTRFAKLGLRVQPWRKGGSKVLVCPQSEQYMTVVADYPGGQLGWLEDVQRKLRWHTDRPIHIRRWDRDKARAAEGFQADLADTWAVVTHSSAAANEALLAGVPVFLTGPGAALSMGLSELDRIEQPRRPDGREAWAAALAGQQFTVDEMRSGDAWRKLNGDQVSRGL